MDRQQSEQINAIELKRRIQEKIYEDTQHMTPEEFIAYMHGRIANSQFVSMLKVAPIEPPEALIHKGL